MALRSPRKFISSGAAAELARMPIWLGVTIIVAAALWVYSPVFHGDWLWDDDWYITSQPLLRDATGLWKFWFAPGSWVEYYPLEETLLWVEWHLFGNDTLGYHFVTIGLHAANALLVWRLLARLGVRKAWLGGLIFAVHPAAVDSVAWIAETKNTLVLLPFLLCLIAWIDFEESRSRYDYQLALVLFLAAMLCKISVAPLPVVLLLFAWWKRGRIRGSDLAAVAPFFVISLVLGLLTIDCGSWYYLHHDKFGQDATLGGGAFRLALAAQALAHYFAHIVWPVGLLPIYPQWNIDPNAPLQYLPWIALLAVALGCWIYRTGWGRHVLLGLGFFVLFLAPFLGFVGATYMNFSWIMDHFLYVPIIGLIGLFVAAVQAAENSMPTAARPAVTGFVTLIAVLLAFESHAYAQVYTDEASLWNYTLEHDPNSWLANYNFGNALFVTGNFSEAIAFYEHALKEKPDDVMAHNNLGLAYAQTGRLPEAKVQFETAVRLMPTFAGARHNLDQANALLNAQP
jgi:tetratricopeptide (TPR) repeat protein